MYKYAPRGFVFSKLKLDLDLEFININDCFFYYEQDLDFRIKKSRDGQFILLIGTFLDIRNTTSSIDKSMDALFESLKSNKMHEELDFYSGRYVIIYYEEGKIKALSDATSMKSIYYNDNFNIVSSHFSYFKKIDESITLSALEKYRLTKCKRGYKYGYPGFYTPYKGYRILPPNFEINITDKNIQRFFPREGLLQDLDVNEIVADIYLYMSNQIKSLINMNKKLYSSLTAGVDSRYTLTVTKDFEEIQHFTYFYDGNKIHLSDVNWSKIISKILKLNYFVLDVDGEFNYSSVDYKNYSLNLRNNSVYGTHAHRISFAYSQKFGSNSVLIRSNLYEIGRQFFSDRLKNINFDRNSAIDLAKTFTYLYDKNLLGSILVQDVFLEYSKTLVNNAIYNYDPIDLFYWEHRMGIWHSLVVSETDPAAETIVLCNARKILNLFLSVTPEDRQGAVLFKHAIQQYLPELKNLPINKILDDVYDSFDVVLKISEDYIDVSIYEAEDSDDHEYAFYVYLNNKKIDTKWYSKANSLRYKMTQPGVYAVRGFIKKQDNVIVAKTSNAARYLGSIKNLDINELNSSNLVEGRNDIRTSNYIFNTFYKKGTSSKLTVLLNGAVGDRKKVILPVFQRYSWASEIEDHVLNINDPTLELDKNLRLGWYLGSKKFPLLPEIREVILQVAKSLNISIGDIVIYGSSGGGFAALNIAAYMGNNIKSVAINPQIQIKDYIATSTVNLFYEVSGFEYSDYHTSIIDVIRSKENDFKGLIYQNEKDVHHYTKHFTPLLEALNIGTNNFIHSNIKYIIFNDPRGHVGESKNMFSELIATVRRQ
ncbi:hypothetical protein DC083_03430 [Ignatzschineria ureiclastica]|uniref:Uncharacterized protein n=1 Tax=Ignatzschineria ureiclastica TaxID=472582 RepID=A0A2U2AFT1_9GAMM|nr:hypothetical protein [Ignatzschineria ureiclastica]PWD81512.1 hypothetical protein DC083_03430 [Ignatzschineria ureiclastica]GHA01210.1 hypothetical protein GCM10007162_16920 [Ignatzschineria ureiclastica]